MHPVSVLLGVDSLPSMQLVLTLGGLLVVCVVAVVALWVEFSIVHSVTSYSGDDAEPKRNCPNCGARNPVSRDSCEHCEHRLPDGA